MNVPALHSVLIEQLGCIPTGWAVISSETPREEAGACCKATGSCAIAEDTQSDFSRGNMGHTYSATAHCRSQSFHGLVAVGLSDTLLVGQWCSPKHMLLEDGVRNSSFVFRRCRGLA